MFSECNVFEQFEKASKNYRNIFIICWLCVIIPYIISLQFVNSISDFCFLTFLSILVRFLVITPRKSYKTYMELKNQTDQAVKDWGKNI
jgi:hypothetical protein